MIPAIGIESLSDWLHLDEWLVIDVPEACTDCGSKLWSHGSYERSVTANGQRFIISVPRVVCSQCRRSHAALYTFLVPHKRYCAEAYDGSLALHLSGCSYREAAWTEGTMSSSAAFRAIVEASEAAPEVVQILQAHCVANEIVLTESLPNKGGKSILRRAAGLVSDIGRQISSRIFLWWRRIGKPRRGMSLVFRLSATQSLQHPLF